MGKKSVRQQMSEQLLKRMEESSRRVEGGQRSYFKKELPEGIKFWKCTKGDRLIDVIPYIVGPDDPNTPESEMAHVLEIEVHRNVGPGDNIDIVCLNRNYNQKCPICEHQSQLRREGVDDAILKKLNPKRRCLYNIVCYDSADDERKGVQVWEVAHWFSERHFLELAKGPRRPGRKEAAGFIAYSHPDDGKSLSFKREGEGMENTFFVGHKFVDRDYAIEDDVLDAAYVLDQLIYIPTYQEAFDLYFGEEFEEESEKEEMPPESEEEGLEEEKIEEENEEEEEEEDLEDMDLAELKAYAKKKGMKIKGMRSMDEDDLREAIEDWLDENE